jgi:hypothetical protein
MGKTSTFSEFSKSIWLYVAGICRRFYYWVFAFALDPLDLYDRFLKSALPEKLRFELNMPSEYFPHFLIAGIGWASMMTYHELRLKTEVKDTRQAVDAIQTTHDSGVSLKERIYRSGDETPIAEWGQQYHAWRAEMKKVVAKYVGTGKAQYADGIQMVPMGDLVGMPNSAERQQKIQIIRHLNARLERLAEIMRDL